MFVCIFSQDFIRSFVCLFFQGFETRGTEIHSRAWTLKNLYQQENILYFLQPNATLVLEDLHIPPELLETLGNHHPARPPHHKDRMKRDVQAKELSSDDGFGLCHKFACESTLKFQCNYFSVILFFWKRPPHCNF